MERQAQDKRLATLQHDPEAAWKRVDDLLATRGTRHYREVIRLLTDLGALADREGTSDVHAERYHQFLSRPRTKKALLRDLETQHPLKPAR